MRCFFVLDVGHIEFLKKARSMGTYLLVGIHDDRVRQCESFVHC